MKFMTITQYTDSYYSLSADEKAKLMQAAVKELYNLKKEKGEDFHFYNPVGSGRYVSIGEYGSVEEYIQSIQTNAIQGGYVKAESYALTEATMEQIENLYQGSIT